MNNGIYMALTGSLAVQKRVEIVSNNLANVNTAGFKRDVLAFDTLLERAKNPALLDVAVPADLPYIDTRFSTDYSTGTLRQTGNQLDVALEGEGFFSVNTPNGVGYTRQGNFRLDAGGKLVTTAGFEVLANGNPVVIRGKDVTIDGTGAVLVDGARVAKLDVVDFPKPYPLEKTGNSVFRADPTATPQAVTAPIVRQGFIEDSNVNAVTELVQLIESTRHYECCVKVIQNYDQIAGKASNELGKV